MVEFVTEPQEVQTSDLNVLLGSFQRAEQGAIGTLGQGVAAGVNTFAAAKRSSREDTDIDPVLFAQLAAVNPQALKKLQRGVARADAKEDQSGKSSAIGRSAFINEAIARGVPVEVVARTTRQAGSSVIEIARRAEAEILGTGKTEREILTTEAIRLGGIPFLSLTDAELRSQVGQRQLDVAKLELAEHDLSVLTTQEGINTEFVASHIRVNIIPGRVNELHVKVNEFIQAQGLVLNEDGTVNVDQLGPGDMAGIHQELDNFFIRQRQQLQADTFDRLSIAQLDDAMSTLRFYVDQAKDVVSGKATVDSLNSINEHREAFARHKFFTDNPGAADSMALVDQLSPRIAQLGIGGFDIARNVSDLLLIPLFESGLVNVLDSLKQLGVEPADQERVLKILSDTVVGGADIETRGRAISNLLPSLLKAGEQDPAIFRAMFEMFASPEGVKAVIEGIQDSGIRKEALDQVKRGFFNARVSYQDAFAAELNKRLSQVVFQEPFDFADSRQRIRIGQPALSEFRGEKFSKRLGDFIADNLFDEDEISIDLNSLEDLTEKQREAVMFHYKRLIEEFGTELAQINAIQQNFLTQQEIRAFSRTPEIEEQDFRLEQDEEIEVNLIDGRNGENDVSPLRRHAEQNIRFGTVKENDDGTISSVRSTSVQDENLNDGKITLIPRIYDGELVSVPEAIDRAIKSGIQWPTFDTEAEATAASKGVSDDILIAPRTTIATDTGPVSSTDTRTPEERVRQQNKIRDRFNRSTEVDR